ncbi:lipopolysaccharide-binding protein-like [Sorex araneus]|uniref:lipopolysaccharide-binding protein-like n=1 Tax=Sorex araneus TaxID=42254 RepID=UPI002433FE92|nr:lipopolysaccharide-binding protein-like [Sorex araneus]
MKASLSWAALVLLLLAQLSRLGKGTANPGFIARITKKGVEYARQYGVASVKKELSSLAIPDFSGSYDVSWFLSVTYEFRKLQIRDFQLPYSDLRLLPEHGVRATLSDSYLNLQGSWKVSKGFITLTGTFDVKVDDIYFSVTLNLGKNPSGRPTASVSHCSNSVGPVSVVISGYLSWILNLFHHRIENNLKHFLENEMCDMIRKLATSQLQPYLQTLPVTVMVDDVASIDYRLVGAPVVTSQALDTPFKAEFFYQGGLFPSSLHAPPIQLPQAHNRMVYFAVSEYVFNTASWVYHQAGHMNFTLKNEHLENFTKLMDNQQARELRRKYLNPGCRQSANATVTSMASCHLSDFLLGLMHIPLGSDIRLNTDSFQVAIPQLARLYPKMELELDVSPESAPLLSFTTGDVTVQAVMDVQAFVLLPNSRKPVFQLRVSTNISATIIVKSTRISGSVSTGSKLKLELKHSDIGSFNVELMENILNYFALHTIYPSLNAKLEEGFPLPLPRDTYISSLVFQIHQNFFLLGANIS